MLRRRIASELRRLRTDAGLTVDQARQHIGVARSTMGRIERAEVAVSVGNVQALLALYGVAPDDAARLVELAKLARKRGWWQRYGDVLPDWFSVYVGLESEASHISEYEPQLVPGILQTEDYARALVEAEHHSDTEQEKARRVELRMQRQQREEPPAMWLVLDEAALCRPVGGRDVMRAQLKRVLEASHQPGNTVQVLPFEVGEHASMGTPMTILSFADPRDTPVVYIENHTGGLYLDEAPEVERYADLFEHLQAAAASIRRSREILTDAIDRL